MATVQRVAGLVAAWSRQAKAITPALRCAEMSTVAAAQAPAHAEASASSAAGAATQQSVSDLTDAQVVHLLKSGVMSPHRLEIDLNDSSRAVRVRRAYIADMLSTQPVPTGARPASGAFTNLPVTGFDTASFYNSILNTNCEAVIGYVPLPVGVVGPLVLDGRPFYVPMATTEGALLASTNRGCAAIRRAGGATTVLMAEGMTRAPLVRVESLAEAAALRAWLQVPANRDAVAAAFNSTSRFGRLQSIMTSTAGRNVYLRFKASTGDAMGMNMITKGVNEALKLIHKQFPSMHVLSLSGNMCTDKKPSAVNWIEGRGKSVAAEVRLSGHVLKTVLKTNADAMVELNTAKNLVGSALAGSVGGFNAHASNILTAVFLATGQDPAQNVESSTCLTLMEKAQIYDAADPEGKAGPGIIMTVTMPSVEVGTVGGGTSLPAQAACLEMLGVKGSNAERPGANSETLARVVAGAVLAGELSLMSALTTNDLLSSHMKLNRKHGDAEAAVPTAMAVSPAMAAKLREMTNLHTVAAQPEGGVQYTTVYTASNAAHGASKETTHHAAFASGASTPAAAGAMPGGVPAGAHAHPMHVQSASSNAPSGSAASPGRRYFAAPSSRGVNARMSASAVAAAAAGLNASAGVPSFSFAAARASPAAAAFDDEEPMLPVP